jgi:hypothetical protein
MTPRSPRETLESLRVTLHKLEQSTDAASDGQDAAELKQILLNRIAELETLNALNPADPEPVAATAPSDLPPLAIAVTEEQPGKDVAEKLPLEKLD